MEERFRIDELAERASNALIGELFGSGRVNGLPDRRMLRYYTTLGLLDRPVEVQGRVAYYGRRHLLQVVAIKRLQAAGASLAEVQQRLAGASTAELERIAALPSEDQTTPRAFWLSAPAAAGPAVPPSVPAVAAVPPPPPAGTPPPPLPEPIAVRLANGVTLVVDAARPLPPEAHDALRAAARPLLDRLAPYQKER